ncbi:MAG: hypothetical protein APF80_12620 [Alphaproteobacteria bacterium BRH_c36]|nr:MAG: hypothetical protein APF80_12620 [Alphaproteobacteria bacterium BRH_c36]
MFYHESEHSYAFLNTSIDKPAPEGRWTSGPSFDDRGNFRTEKAQPLGQEPSLGKARSGAGAQNEQM